MIIKGQLAYCPETGEFWWMCQSRTRTRPLDSPAGSVNRDGYKMLKLDGKRRLAHRVAWEFMFGDAPQFLDHANGDKLDNRACNLRPATKPQNCANQKLRVTNRSGHKNVSRHGNLWRVSIQKDGVFHRFGLFASLKTAARVAERERVRLFGEFARSA